MSVPSRREPSLFLIGLVVGAVLMAFGFLVAGCAPKPDLSKCYRAPTESEFLCDDCPEDYPQRCGLEND